jgi:hypothetical protein
MTFGDTARVRGHGILSLEIFNMCTMVYAFKATSFASFDISHISIYLGIILLQLPTFQSPLSPPPAPRLQNDPPLALLDPQYAQ